MTFKTVAFQELNDIKESATYMCYANNSIGLAKKTFQINVQYPPELDEGADKEIHSTADVYHGLNLECSIIGSPEPEISWYFVSKRD